MTRMVGKPSKTRLMKNEEIRQFNQKRFALIAAAPELLKACDDGEKLLAYDDDTTEDELRAMIDQVRDFLSAAIAKAEGKTI